MDVFSYLLGKNEGGGGTVNLQDKDVTITANGSQSVTPDAGYDGLQEVNITTSVTPINQTKSLTITENTTTTITPDVGYDGLSSVEVTTNVSGGMPSINSFNDLNTYGAQVIDNFNTYINNDYNNREVYTSNPITLYTPNTDFKNYIIRKSSSGKYSIAWTHTIKKFACITLNSGNISVWTHGAFYIHNYSSASLMRSVEDIKNAIFPLGISAGSGEIGKVGYYYSNETFDTVEDLINEISNPNGNITYTNWTSNNYYNITPDTPYILPCSNMIMFDIRNNANTLVETRIISKNETIEVKPS